MKEMRLLVRFGRRHHPINTAKYGRPRFALYWATADFANPGLYASNGETWQRRVLPWPRVRFEWLGRCDWTSGHRDPTLFERCPWGINRHRRGCYIKLGNRGLSIWWKHWDTSAPTSREPRS